MTLLSFALTIFIILSLTPSLTLNTLSHSTRTLIHTRLSIYIYIILSVTLSHTLSLSYYYYYYYYYDDFSIDSFSSVTIAHCRLFVLSQPLTDLLKIQQQREKDLLKFQQLREKDLLKFQQLRTYSKLSNSMYIT